jgi:phenylpropionate dioxygenase-like ring-hydroxylating dioxygenase large terminal subunit
MSDSALRSYWHPVATSASLLPEKPLGAVLLDERIVIWRAGPRLAAFRDLCIHRGTALSRGWIDGECLVCPYHGWTYADDGACVRIPALGPGASIPRKARATAVYQVQERYGLVWVCLGSPVAAIPALPEIDAAEYHTFLWGSGVWETSAARLVENFIDPSHFPYVHAGLNATADDPVLPAFEVRRTPEELRFETRFTAPTSGTFQGPAALASYAAFTEGRRQYRVVPPFTAQAIRPMPDGTRQLVSVIASPVSEKRTCYFLFSSRNFALDQPDTPFRELISTIMEQDREIVETQRPEELPLDLSEELHLRGPDAGTLAYRQMLGALALA